MKLLLICFSAFALFCDVHAGFCDNNPGRHCRYKDGYGLVATYCSCTYKRRRLSKKKYSGYKSYSKAKFKYSGSKLKRDCDSVNDVRCYDGCNTGRCLTSFEVCATTALNNVAWNGHNLKDTCPSVVLPSHKTWKNRVTNSDAIEQGYLQRTVGANTAWSKQILLPKFYATDAKGIEEINKVWDTNCKTDDVRKMNCLTNFPKCVGNVGIKGAGSNGDCLNYCKKVMLCVTEVQAACVDNNKEDLTKCNKFGTFGPKGGNVDCNALCKENQNDYNRDAGSTLGLFMSVAIACTIAVIM